MSRRKQSPTRFVRYFGRTIVPAICLGFVTGCAVAFVWFHWGAHHPGPTEWLAILCPLIASLVASFAVLRITYRERRWFGWVGAVALFSLMTPIAMFRQIAWEQDQLEHRISSASSIIVSSSGLRSVLCQLEVAPSPKTWERWYDFEVGLRRNWGIGHFDWIKHIDLAASSSHIGIESASRFPLVESIAIRAGCSITDTEFRAFNFRCLRHLYVEAGTQLSAEALRGVDLSKLQSLTLAGENIDDELLGSIGATPDLCELSLSDTQVTAEGLRQFASVTRPMLTTIKLRDLPTGDEVFDPLKDFPTLRFVDLAGLKIRGTGLKHLPNGCQWLILDDTPLDWSQLAGLLPLNRTDANNKNAAVLASVSLVNTPYQAESVDVLTELAAHVWSLDVGLLPLPNELFQNENLKLTMCGLDAMSVDLANIELYGSVRLRLHYDAQQSSTEEIVSHVQAVCDAQFEKLKQTAKQMRLPAPKEQQKGSVEVVVHRLNVTEKALATLQPIEDQHYAVQLRDAIGPDGREVQANSIYSIRAIYPNLEAASEEGQSPQ